MHGHERLTTYEREFAKAVARGEDDVAKHDYVHAVQALRRARFYHAGIARLRRLSPNAPCHACQALQSTIKLAQKAQRDSTEEKADLSWHPPRPSQDSDGMGGADGGPADLVPGAPRHGSAFVDHVNHDGNKAAQSSLDRRERAGTRRRFGNLTAKQWAAARHIANEGCVPLACLCAFVLLCLTWLLVLGRVVCQRTLVVNDKCASSQVTTRPHEQERTGCMVAEVCGGALCQKIFTRITHQPR